MNFPRISFAAFISLCLLYAQQTSAYSIPKWFLNPPRDTQATLYGIGESTTVEGATKEALNQIASKLSVTIGSTWEKTEEQATTGRNASYSGNIRNNVKSEVADISFNNYEVVNNEVEGPNIYVLVSVNRSTLLAEKKNDLTNLDTTIQNLYSAAQKKSIIERLVDHSRIEKEINKATQLLGLVYSLDPSFEPRPYFDKYNTYLDEGRKAFNDVHIFLSAFSAAQEVISIVKEHLNNANLSIVPSKDDSDTNLVMLSIKTDTKKMELYSSKMVKVFTTFEVRTFANKIIASSQIEAKGSSMISYEEAIKAAALNLDAALKKKGILNVLGINRP